MQNIKSLGLSIFVVAICSPHGSASEGPLPTASQPSPVCDLNFLARGMSATDFVEKMSTLCEFLRKANTKLREATGNPAAEVNVLTSGHLQAFYEEGVDSFMVVGRSADFKPEEAQLERDVRAEITSGLNRFDRHRTVFFPGGTASGTIGAFHDVAVRRGFRVVGLTSLAAVKYEPALMTDVYLEVGTAFGAESNTALRFAKAVLMLGGGKQAAREAIKGAFAEKKPTYIVENSRFGGKSAEVSAALDRNPQASLFPSFAAAAAKIPAADANVLNHLPAGAFDLSASDVKAIYKDVTLLGFSTWAANAPAARRQRDFRKLAIDLLDKLDPKKVVLVVAGSEAGGEGLVIREAAARGFDMIGTPVTDTLAQLSPKVTKHVISGRRWTTRNHAFVHLLDGLVTAGPSPTILKHVEIAAENKTPVFHLRGLSSEIDAFIGNLDENILVREGEADRIIAALEARTRRTLRRDAGCGGAMDQAPAPR